MEAVRSMVASGAASSDEEALAHVAAKATLKDGDAVLQIAALNAAKEIEEDGEPLEGNIYTYFAFREFMEQKHVGQDSILNPPQRLFDRIVVRAGLALIVVIQIMSPIGILTGNIFKLLDSIYNPFSEHAPFWNYTPSQWIVVLCAQAFTFCFILSAYKGTVSDLASMQRFAALADLMEKHGQPVSRCVMLLDAIVNSYGAVFLSLSMFTILFMEENAQGVIMDSLSLAFVLNIDDLSSDLGFLSDVWDPVKVGKFFHVLRLADAASSKDPESQSSESEDGTDTGRIAKMEKAAMEELSKDFMKIPVIIYSVTKVLLMLMLPFALFSPFFLKTGAKTDDNFHKLMNGGLFNDIINKSGMHFES